MKTICVFCSSSDAVAPVYFAAARDLGARMAARGDSLVYGGGNIGLMGALARAIHAGGGRVCGVIPEWLRARELAYEEADELIVTRDLRERKAAMEARADAFIAMPGGFGTLEEVIEILTLKQLGGTDKAIVFLNTAGFYDPLMALFEEFYAGHFAHPESRALYYLSPSPEDALAHIDGLRPER